MATADRALPHAATRPFIGVRQRVLLVLLAATLAVVTQRPPADPPPEDTGYLNTVVEVGGERFRLACQGSGEATVVFLELPGAWPSTVWIRAQTWMATFTRVCVFFTTSAGARAAMVNPALTDQMAGDLDRALALHKVSTPYIIVATTPLTPIAESLVVGSAGQINGGLVLEPANDPVTGWIIHPDGNQQAVTLRDLEQVGDAIQSLF